MKTCGTNFSETQSGYGQQWYTFAIKSYSTFRNRQRHLGTTRYTAASCIGEWWYGLHSTPPETQGRIANMNLWPTLWQERRTQPGTQELWRTGKRTLVYIAEDDQASSSCQQKGPEERQEQECREPSMVEATYASA